MLAKTTPLIDTLVKVFILKENMPQEYRSFHPHVEACLAASCYRASLDAAFRREATRTRTQRNANKPWDEGREH